MFTSSSLTNRLHSIDSIASPLQLVTRSSVTSVTFFREIITPAVWHRTRTYRRPTSLSLNICFSSSGLITSVHLRLPVRQFLEGPAGPMFTSSSLTNRLHSIDSIASPLQLVTRSSVTSVTFSGETITPAVRHGIRTLGCGACRHRCEEKCS